MEERGVTLIELSRIDGVTAATLDASFAVLIDFSSVGMEVSWVKDSWKTTFNLEDPCDEHTKDTEDDQVHFTCVKNLFQVNSVE
jgi:hypothetical protein